jgi:hypothetical protein
MGFRHNSALRARTETVAAACLHCALQTFSTTTTSARLALRAASSAHQRRREARRRMGKDERRMGKALGDARLARRTVCWMHAARAGGEAAPMAACETAGWAAAAGEAAWRNGVAMSSIGENTRLTRGVRDTGLAAPGQGLVRPAWLEEDAPQRPSGQGCRSRPAPHQGAAPGCALPDAQVQHEAARGPRLHA